MPIRTAGHTKLLFLVGLGAFLLAILPVVFAFLTPPPGYVFGGFLFNPIDSNTYLAKMHTGWSGGWRYTFPYTAHETPGAYLFLFYIFLGHVARILGLPLLVVYHLARAISAALLLVSLLFFFRRCLPDRRSADLAFILAALGSGMGWLALPLNAVTTDMWVPEAYPFFSAYTTPHFSLGLAILLGLLGLFLVPEPGLQGWLLAGLGALALAVLSPFGVIIVVTVALAFLGWEWARMARRNAAGAGHSPWLLWRGSLVTLGAVISCGGPLLVYYAWLPGSDPVIAGWNAQNLTPSPPVWDLALSLSPALLLALLAFRPAGREAHAGPRLLAAWLVTGFLLLWLPLGLQRRFLMGLFVPAAGLAGWALTLLAARFPRGWKRLAGLAIGLPLPTLFLILFLGGFAVWSIDNNFYLSVREYRALVWLQENAPDGSVVLATPRLGTFVPAYTGARVLYGHPFETADSEAEEAALIDFFAASPQPAAPCALLAERDVDFMFQGERERGLSRIPSACRTDEPVYVDGEVMIFRVER